MTLAPRVLRHAAAAAAEDGPRTLPRICRVSPLIVRLCRRDRVDLDAVLRRIASPEEADAGRRRMASVMAGHSVAAHYARYYAGGAPPVLKPKVIGGRGRFAFAARHLGCGVVVREWSDPAGALGFRIARGRVEMEARIGAALLSTDGPWATLHLRHRLPETLAIAMRGRPLSALVEHPLLGDDCFRVATVWQPPEQDSALVRFRTGLCRWETAG